VISSVTAFARLTGRKAISSISSERTTTTTMVIAIIASQPQLWVKNIV
jgi:hypothetical protein